MLLHVEIMVDQERNNKNKHVQFERSSISPLLSQLDPTKPLTTLISFFSFTFIYSTFSSHFFSFTSTSALKSLLANISSSSLSPPLLSCLLKSLLSFVSLPLSSPPFCLLPAFLSHPSYSIHLCLFFIISPLILSCDPSSNFILCALFVRAPAFQVRSPVLSWPFIASSPLLYVMDGAGQCAAADSDSLCHCSVCGR